MAIDSGGRTNVLKLQGYFHILEESVKYHDDEKTQLEERKDYKDGLE